MATQVIEKTQAKPEITLPKKKEPPRLEFISLLRVAAIALVVLGHSLHAYTGGWVYTSIIKSELLTKLTYYIYTIHMPLLVFIAGYLYAFQRWELGKYEKSDIFVAKKALRLLVPYFVIAFCYMVPVKYLLHLYSTQALPGVAWQDIILAKDPGHLWFLLMLFNIFVIFRLLEPALNKKNMYLFLPIFFAISFLRYFLPNVFQISAAFYYLPIFYLGFLARSGLKDINLKKSYALIPVLFATHLYMYLYNPSLISINSPLVPIISRYLLTIIAISWVFLLGIFITEKWGSKFKGVVRLMDRNAMTTYLLHEEIVFFLFALLLDKTNYLLTAGFVFVSAMVSTIIFGEIFAKRSKVLKLALGG